jgi:hypothetical protein
MRYGQNINLEMTTRDETGRKIDNTRFPLTEKDLAGVIKMFIDKFGLSFSKFYKYLQKEESINAFDV